MGPRDNDALSTHFGEQWLCTFTITKHRKCVMQFPMEMWLLTKFLIPLTPREGGILPTTDPKGIPRDNSLINCEACPVNTWM